MQEPTLFDIQEPDSVQDITDYILIRNRNYLITLKSDRFGDLKDKKVPAAWDGMNFIYKSWTIKKSEVVIGKELD